MTEARPGTWPDEVQFPVSSTPLRPIVSGQLSGKIARRRAF